MDTHTRTSLIRAAIRMSDAFSRMSAEADKPQDSGHRRRRLGHAVRRLSRAQDALFAHPGAQEPGGTELAVCAVHVLRGAQAARDFSTIATGETLVATVMRVKS
jgi:uncharacterized membrane protein YccC